MTVRTLKDVSYCNYGGWPCVYRNGEAWAYHKAAWHRVDSAEVAAGAAVLGKALFDSNFGELPDLPTNAFA